MLPELSEKLIMLPSYERHSVIYRILLTVTAPPFGFNKKTPIPQWDESSSHGSTQITAV